jgi:hygromycin-B 7''-O-kinase
VLVDPIPAWADTDEYLSLVQRTEPWSRMILEICAREGIRPAERPSTLSSRDAPVILLPPDHIVKLLGPPKHGLSRFEGEERAYRLLAGTDGIPIPRLVGSGAMDQEWRYLLITRMPGTPLTGAWASMDEPGRSATVEWLADVVQRIHRTPIGAVVDRAVIDGFAGRTAARLRHAPEFQGKLGSLPHHLLEQMEDWLPTPDELVAACGEPVLLHADLTADNILGHARSGSFDPTAIIDFGFSTIGSPYQELGPIWRYVCDGRPDLFGQFLRAMRLPGSTDRSFERMVLAHLLIYPGDQWWDLPWLEDVPDLDALGRRVMAGV